MVACYLDVTAEQLMRNEALRTLGHEAGHHPLIQRYTDRTPYIRLVLHATSKDQLYAQLVQITATECIPWMLWHERERLLFLKERRYLDPLEERAKQRFGQIQPQLELLIGDDLHKLMRHTGTICSWNIHGYYCFAAQKVKWLVRTLLQEEYQAIREEAERDGFIALLQFCVDVQPSLVRQVHLTLLEDAFTLLDDWGNDLRQLYLDALPEEEYLDVGINDLVLSILMTMLPESIHIFVSEAQATQHTALLKLLQQVFIDRIIIHRLESE